MSCDGINTARRCTLVRILEPLKERATATLKARGDLFIYLDKTGRTVKITSGMMGGSWMGSHFTKDDLLHQSRLSRDYDVKLADPGAPGRATYRFTLKAKPNAAVVWDRLEVTVRRSDLQPLVEVFYDEEVSHRCAPSPRRAEASRTRSAAGQLSEELPAARDVVPVDPRAPLVDAEGGAGLEPRGGLAVPAEGVEHLRHEEEGAGVAGVVGEGPGEVLERARVVPERPGDDVVVEAEDPVGSSPLV
jgi:hypothetical protein